ncbi:hypothetical protein VOLCADRAFT_92378, partial [Volvox carteri f. nagariensis]
TRITQLMSYTLRHEALRPRIMDDSTGWAQLGRDALAAIFSFLNPRDLAAAGCICRDTRNVAYDNALWQPLLAHYFGLNVQAPNHMSLAALFRNLYEACKPSSSGGSGGNAASPVSPYLSPLSGAISLEGLYTDGGMDMGDPAFWAGNVFQPHGWSLYCSRAGSNVHCIAQLKAVRSEDPFTVSHRSELISLASEVAWLLFLGRMPARIMQRMLTAAAAAAGGAAVAVPAAGTTSSSSRNPARTAAPASTAAAAPRARAVVALCERLRDAMRHSLRRWSTAGLRRLVWQLISHYHLLLQQQRQQQERQKGGGSGGPEGAAGGPLPVPVPLPLPDLVGWGQAAATAAAAGEATKNGDIRVGGGGGGQPPVEAFPEGVMMTEAVEAVPLSLPPRLAAVGWDIVQAAGGRSVPGGRELVGLGEDGAGLKVWCRTAREYLSSPALECTTSIIDGITVSRTGEFTCPVACGAIFLAHRSPATNLRQVPPQPRTKKPPLSPLSPAAAGRDKKAADGATQHVSSSEEGEIGVVGPGEREEEGGEQRDVQQEFEGMVRQPYVQALSDLTTLAAVEAAASAGLLPPVVARGSCPREGGWVEFQRPPPAAAQTASPSSPSRVPYGSRLTEVPAWRAAESAPVAESAEAATTGEIGSAAAAGVPDAGGGGGGATAAATMAAGVLWPVAWFRFFPHDGLGDEGDQGMALPPVLPPPPPVDDPDDPDPDPYVNAPPSPIPVADLLPWDSGAFSSVEGSSTEEVEEDEDEEEEDEDEEEDGNSNSALTDSSSSIDADGGGGWGLNGDDTNTDEWEDELDFLYGIEGKPYSYNATAGQSYSDNDDDDKDDDELAVHTFAARGPGADTDAAASGGSGPSNAAAAAAADPRATGPVPDGSAAAAGSLESTVEEAERRRCQDPKAKRRCRQTPHDDDEDDDDDSGRSQGPQQPLGGGGGLGCNIAGGSCDTGAVEGAGNLAAAAAADRAPLYDYCGEMLQGVPLMSWLNHLTKPHVAGVILGWIADVAGMQALRHTFQNVQTALQPSVAKAPSLSPATSIATAAGGTATAATQGAWGAAPQYVYQSLADCSSAAAATSVPTPAKTGGGAAAAAALSEPLAALLPPDNSAERAFEGLEPVPPLLSPPPLPYELLGSPDPGAHGPPADLTQPGQQTAAGGAAAAAAAATAAQPPPSGHLCISLCQRWVGNTVLLKLISPEDRTEAFGEEADLPPNIDVQFLALRGVTLALRPPLRVLPPG